MYQQLHVSDVERHVSNALKHISNGNPDYATGSIRKARKFALRKVRIDIQFGAFGDAIDMNKFNIAWSEWLVSNGVPSELSKLTFDNAEN